MVSSRFEHLRTLSPIEAAQAWLAGDFGIGDEQAMIEAIRREIPIPVSDDQIVDFFADALAEERTDAQACLEELRSRS
ncbi:MAG TPA: hypothetical protein VKY92_11455 [Verrucomicrobiae bacterium]|nr:hypothetical protein [Verrucomicrobiae bacterium]